MKGSTEYQTQLAHLVKLASSPGWREYVKGRLDELEADRSGAGNRINIYQNRYEHLRDIIEAQAVAGCRL